MKETAAATHQDVLIVGAGPAGLACAIAAALQGLRVEVLDAMRPPIDKACGEGLMPGSLEALAAIGVDVGQNLLHTETAPLHGIRFVNEQSSSKPISTTEASFPTVTGRGIRRTVLHQLLLDRAHNLGVRFHWEHSVRDIESTASSSIVRTNRQTFQTRYLVGADGTQSRVAIRAGLTDATIRSRRIGLRQHYSVAPWTHFVEVYWSNYGQAYVTPNSTNQVCVAFIARKKISSPGEALLHFPTLARRLATAEISEAARGSITLNRTLRRVATANVALIGDASGSVDAVTGEGLAQCFRQAEALSRALHAGDLALYQQAHRRIQLPADLMSRNLLLMDRSPRLRARVIQTFERFPILFQRLLEVHIGHRACIFPGIDDLLASGLQVLTS
jgi:flavin-dependent dehydrogenase